MTDVYPANIWDTILEYITVHLLDANGLFVGASVMACVREHRLGDIIDEDSYVTDKTSITFLTLPRSV